MHQFFLCVFEGFEWLLLSKGPSTCMYVHVCVCLCMFVCLYFYIHGPHTNTNYLSLWTNQRSGKTWCQMQVARNERPQRLTEAETIKLEAQTEAEIILNEANSEARIILKR